VRFFQSPRVSEDKDTILFGPYKLIENQKRANTNVVEVSLLVFDIDDPQGKTAHEIMNLVVDYDAILHSTWSHTADTPRYRLIMKLANPVAANQFNEVRSGFLFFNSELASIIDKACSDPARAYYLFSYPIERSHYAVCLTNKGKPINPAHCLKPTNSSSTLQFNTPISAVSGGGFVEGGRNVALTKFIGGLIGQEKTFEETLALGLAWNATLEPPMDESEVRRTHQSIWKTHNRNHPTATQQNVVPNPVALVSKQFTLVPASDLLASPPLLVNGYLTSFYPRRL